MARGAAGAAAGGGGPKLRHPGLAAALAHLDEALGLLALDHARRQLLAVRDLAPEECLQQESLRAAFAHFRVGVDADRLALDGGEFEDMDVLLAVLAVGRERLGVAHPVPALVDAGRCGGEIVDRLHVLRAHLTSLLGVALRQSGKAVARSLPRGGGHRQISCCR
jgi:hypothetical protein